MTSMATHLVVAVCGAGPAADTGGLVPLVRARSWTVQFFATPGALSFVDRPLLEAATGFPVRSEFRQSTGRQVPDVDALLVAPATYNTVNKLALGIADNYALTSVAELIGRAVPTVVVPFVNSALAARAPFANSVAALRSEGVRVLFGSEDGWEPHAPGAGFRRQRDFPWEPALRMLATLAGR